MPNGSAPEPSSWLFDGHLHLGGPKGISNANLASWVLLPHPSLHTFGAVTRFPERNREGLPDSFSLICI